MGDRRRHQSGALNGAASGGEENAVGEKRRGTPERSSPGSSELFSIYLWLESGRVHAGSDLSFCPRSPSGGRHTQQARPCHAGRGAPVVALCPGGKRTIRILQKSKRYNISFQGIKGNKNSAPQKKCGEYDVCQSLFALCLLVSVVIKFFLFLKLNNIK